MSCGGSSVRLLVAPGKRTRLRDFIRDGAYSQDGTWLRSKHRFAPAEPANCETTLSEVIVMRFLVRLVSVVVAIAKPPDRYVTAHAAPAGAALLLLVTLLCGIVFAQDNNP